MTNDTLNRVLVSSYISQGQVVRKIGDIEVILLKKRTTTLCGDRTTKVSGVYTYLFILYKGQRAAIILKCDSVDIHCYVRPWYRDKHILSNAIRGHFLKKLWPDIDSVTCVNRDEYDRIKHLAEIAGYRVRN